MSKAMRGYGCVMKRKKKQSGGAMKPGAMRPIPENLKKKSDSLRRSMRAMPENLKDYLEEKKKNKPEVKKKPHNLSKMLEGK